MIHEDQNSFLRLAGFPHGVVISKEEDTELFDWISKGEKPIVVTMGSGYFFNTKLVNIVTEVSKQLNKRFIVIVQEDAFVNSDMIVFKKHINLHKVLPLCSLFIYHGGAGSIVQAITTGTPSIVVSMAYDQPDNAYHIVKNKLGLSLCEPDLSVSNLIKKIQEVLLSEEIPVSIQEAQKRCLGVDGIENAVQIIEEFVSTKQ
jgi:rhamnosyltransferase subunit B